MEEGMIEVAKRIHPVAVTVGSAAGFFALQRLSSIVSPQLFPQRWKELKEKDKIDHDIRVASMVHALILLRGSIRVMNLIDCPWGWNLAMAIFNQSTHHSSSSLPSAPVLAASETSVVYYAFTVGYFIWDLVQCLLDFEHQGLAFTIHAFFGVVSLAPPIFLGEKMPHLILYYGVAIWLFELSTPFLNLRGFLFTLKQEKGLVYAVNNILFLISFTLARIVMGVPLCASFVSQAYSIDAPLPTWMRVMWMLAGTTSAGLNIMWFYKVIAAVLLRGSDSKKKKENPTPTVTTDKKKNQAIEGEDSQSGSPEKKTD